MCYTAAHMAGADLERFTKLMLDEFGRVHERLDEHDQSCDNIESELRGLRAELRGIRNELDELRDKVDNILGYRKEIDHAMERIARIEKHLGIEKRISA
jgi:tetrahydromethanopterin S-methyltransferase subunit G